jgi:hypothetical protein
VGPLDGLIFGRPTLIVHWMAMGKALQAAFTKSLAQARFGFCDAQHDLSLSILVYRLTRR